MPIRFNDFGCTEDQQKVLDIIIKNKGKAFSAKELAEKAGYSEASHIGNTLKKFTKMGYLTKTGKHKQTKYTNNNE